MNESILKEQYGYFEVMTKNIAIKKLNMYRVYDLV